MNKAKYIFITTQYMENYGTNEVPYMKFKGGSNYQVGPLSPDATENEVATMLAQVRPIITTSLIESGGGCEEYILESKVIEGSDWSGLIEDWDTVTELHYLRGEWTAMKVTDNRGDAMWMRREILEKTESWTCGPHQERKDYKVEFLMENGDFLESQAELSEWLNTKEEAAA
jgi:hypothetical protein